MTDFGGRSLFGRKEEVEATPEFRRVAALPKREYSDAVLEQLADSLTNSLKTPRGTMRLRTIQALALYEIAERGGIFGPMPVGSGKTLVTLLAPYVLDAKKPLLLLPAGLKEKTHKDRLELSKHWRIPINLRVMSFEEMGRVNAANELEHYRPDVIIMDEAHKAKNKKAAVTRRITRYMKEHPETKCILLSGTIMTKSLKDFAHLLRWALKGGAPIPVNEFEMMRWADAIDEFINPIKRVAPGALRAFAEPGDLADGPDEITIARRGFRRRLMATPGIIAAKNAEVACSIYVRALPYEVTGDTDELFRTLRSSWTTPTGWTFSEASELWRHAREMALGLVYTWDPVAPAEWLDARRAWAKFVRETLKRPHVDGEVLDTELQVRRACEKGALDRSVLDAWKAIEPSFVPRSRAEWHCSRVLDLCKEWMGSAPGIVWTEHTLFARELAKRSGVPFYGAQGLDVQTGRSILDADPTKPMIASIDANGTGKNLQAWNRNLITSMPPGSDRLEQLMGRTHRPGQQADEVVFDVLLGCREHFDGMNKARAGAAMVRDSLGQPQKILLADVQWPEEYEYLREYRGFRFDKEVAAPAIWTDV